MNILPQRRFLKHRHFLRAPGLTRVLPLRDAVRPHGAEGMTWQVTVAGGDHQRSLVLQKMAANTEVLVSRHGLAGEVI